MGDRAFILRDEGGVAFRMIGAMTDVSERVRATMALEEAQAQLRLLVEFAQVTLWRADAQTFRFTYVSPEAEKMLGYPADQWVLEPDFWKDHLYEADRDAATAFRVAETAAGRNHSFEYRMVAKGGRAVWLRDLVHVLSENGRPKELIGVFVDVTAAARQRESEAELRAVTEAAAVEWEQTFNSIEDAILMVDAQDTVARANRAGLLAIAPVEVPVPLESLCPKEPWMSASRLVASMRATNSEVRSDVVDLNTRTVWDVTASPHVGFDGPDPRDSRAAILIARNVTEERRVLADREFVTTLWRDLAESTDPEQAMETLLRRVCDATDSVVGQVFTPTDDGSRFVCVAAWFKRDDPLLASFHEASRQALIGVAEGILGRAFAEKAPVQASYLGGREVFSRVDAAAAAGLRCVLAVPAMVGDKVVAIVEFLQRETRAPEVRVASSVATVLSQIGPLIERHRTEQLLRERDRSHAMLLSNLSGMAYRRRNDPSWTIEYVSRGCVELLGHSPEALLLGSPAFGTLVHPSDRDGLRKECEASLAARGPLSIEYRIRTASGLEKWVWDQAHGVYDAEGRLRTIEGFITDVSPRKKAESELEFAGSMAALGELVAGVAHEVRNPLFAISANIDAFEARFSHQGEFAETMGTLRGEVNRLIALMNDLLDYGRPLIETPEAGPLGPVIAQAVRACADLARQSNVRVRDQLDPGLPPVRMDRRRLVQVFQNLISNAIQHTPSGGRVDVGARVDRIGGKTMISCTVFDTGSGFAADDLPRVFEPFFSRRRGGTGLGLAIVRRLVHEHGGSIHARNRASQGAEMEVRLPTGSE